MLPAPLYWQASEGLHSPAEQVRRALWLRATHRLRHLRDQRREEGALIDMRAICLPAQLVCPHIKLSGQTNRALGTAGAAAAATARPRPRKDLVARLLPSFLDVTSTPYRRGPFHTPGGPWLPAPLPLCTIMAQSSAALSSQRPLARSSYVPAPRTPLHAVHAVVKQARPQG